MPSFINFPSKQNGYLLYTYHRLISDILWNFLWGSQVFFFRLQVRSCQKLGLFRRWVLFIDLKNSQHACSGCLFKAYDCMILESNLSRKCQNKQYALPILKVWYQLSNPLVFNLSLLTLEKRVYSVWQRRMELVAKTLDWSWDTTLLWPLLQKEKPLLGANSMLSFSHLSFFWPWV